MRILVWVVVTILTTLFGSIVGIYEAELRCWAELGGCEAIRRELLVSNARGEPVRLFVCYKNGDGAWRWGAWRVAAKVRNVPLAVSFQENLIAHGGKFYFSYMPRPQAPMPTGARTLLLRSPGPCPEGARLGSMRLRRLIESIRDVIGKSKTLLIGGAS